MERVGGGLLAVYHYLNEAACHTSRQEPSGKLSNLFITYSLKNSKDFFGLCLLVLNIASKTSVGAALSTLP